MPRDRMGEAAEDLDATYAVLDLGLDPEGTWPLSVFDEAYVFEGTLTSWSPRF
ncbi:hypothetical protein [Streptomyces sp. B6B3]|uniref:hypothetical protein n=1 Tax=Streptomyces sp. B6B3 TaxID=3153570 RepID=UPI00325F2C06